jgi:hypothetical protein
MSISLCNGTSRLEILGKNLEMVQASTEFEEEDIVVSYCCHGPDIMCDATSHVNLALPQTPVNKCTLIYFKSLVEEESSFDACLKLENLQRRNVEYLCNYFCLYADFSERVSETYHSASEDQAEEKVLQNFIRHKYFDSEPAVCASNYVTQERLTKLFIEMEKPNLDLALFFK